MTPANFRESLQNDSPPETIADVLKAMWYAGKGDWEQAHNIAQDVHSTEGSWVHAYLHRQEGDDGNAGYWYAKAGRKFPAIGLDQEWELICEQLLRTQLS